MALTVENMFVEQTTSVLLIAPSGSLPALDRKRMLEHVIAEAASQVLSSPGTNPIGLTITVDLKNYEGRTELAVLATCPRYELDDDFFSI